MKRQDKYWLASISIIVLVVGMATYRNQKNQERLTTEAQSQALRELANRQDQANRQDLSTREEIDRQLSETALRNELNSASRRESALQAQITCHGCGETAGGGKGTAGAPSAACSASEAGELRPYSGVPRIN